MASTRQRSNGLEMEARAPQIHVRYFDKILEGEDGRGFLISQFLDLASGICLRLRPI